MFMKGSLENHLLCFRPCSFTSKSLLILILSDPVGSVEGQLALHLEIKKNMRIYNLILVLDSPSF